MGASCYYLLDLEVNPLDGFGPSLTLCVRLDTGTFNKGWSLLKKEGGVPHYLNLSKLSLSESRCQMDLGKQGILIFTPLR